MYNTQHTMQQAALTFKVREAIEGDEALKAEAEGVPIKFAEHLKELEQHLHKEWSYLSKQHQHAWHLRKGQQCSGQHAWLASSCACKVSHQTFAAAHGPACQVATANCSQGRQCWSHN